MDKGTEILDELIEQIYLCREEGRAATLETLKARGEGFSGDIISRAIQGGLLVEEGANLIFTEKGENHAITLIRAHRLAERLFSDVLDIKGDVMETNACTFEHFLSKEIMAAICTLLGHPTFCPHGKQIPPGDCCEAGLKEVGKVIYTLDEIEAGERVRVLYIRTQHHNRLDQLMSLGVTPGREVMVHQTKPAFVVRCGETDIALDKAICREILVRKKEG